VERTATFHSVAIEPECSPDTTPPVTTLRLDGAAPAAAYDEAVTATFSATDAGAGASGVAYTEYRVDSGAWRRYSPAAPPTVSGDGSHRIDYRSADLAGNIETMRSRTFVIDTTPPTGTDPGPPPQGNPGNPGPPPAPPGGGPGPASPRDAALRASVRPGRDVVGPRARRVRFRFRVANTGGVAATDVRVCVRAPERRVDVVGRRCRTVRSLAAGRSVTRTFTLRLKRAARGRTTRIRFTATGDGLARRTDVATLRMRRP
jgi:hypothetical protein